MIAALAQSGTGVISTQVLQEFYVTVTRTLGVAPLAAKRVLPFWDALIVAAAASGGCVIVYSENLNPGRTIQGVRIENPLAKTTDSTRGRTGSLRAA